MKKTNKLHLYIGLILITVIIATTAVLGSGGNFQGFLKLSNLSDVTTKNKPTTSIANSNQIPENKKTMPTFSDLTVEKITTTQYRPETKITFRVNDLNYKRLVSLDVYRAGDLEILPPMSEPIKSWGYDITSNGTYTETWNGMDDQNTPVPDGEYAIRVSDISSTGTNLPSPMQGIHKPILITSPSFNNLKIAKTGVDMVFSYDVYNLNYTRSWQLAIHKASDVDMTTLLPKTDSPVMVWNVNKNSSGINSHSWNGFDMNQNQVAPGNYIAKLVDISPSGSGETKPMTSIVKTFSFP